MLKKYRIKKIHAYNNDFLFKLFTKNSKYGIYDLDDGYTFTMTKVN